MDPTRSAPSRRGRLVDPSHDLDSLGHRIAGSTLPIEVLNASAAATDQTSMFGLVCSRGAADEAALSQWDPHGHSGEPAGQLSLGEISDVNEFEADGEAVDE